MFFFDASYMRLVGALEHNLFLRPKLVTNNFECCPSDSNLVLSLFFLFFLPLLLGALFNAVCQGFIII
jgi:hypothetical protein